MSGESKKTEAEVRRIFVEKCQGFDPEAQNLFKELTESLGVNGLDAVRVINRYDVAGLTDDTYALSRRLVFADPSLDLVFDETLPLEAGERVFAVEFLPGQFDQRADSAAQCLQILTGQDRPQVVSARVIILKGNISDDDFARVKEHCINPIESREVPLHKPQTLGAEAGEQPDVEELDGFNSKSAGELRDFLAGMGLAMNLEDLLFCQAYFRETAKREPTLTEIRVLDTYWSDHCRHTTFLTKIEEINFESGHFTAPVQEAFQEYLLSRKYVYGEQQAEKDICLMDIALMAMQELRKKGLLEDLDESEEINACSIVVKATVDGQEEEWLVMFKNETHNHPTEMEPFGGAATCLGGAIRDPLAGRAYVYQAMRVTGCADPRGKLADTLPGKLPQRKITTGAAAGYSTYGNQIGVAAGQVAELYDAGFLAKRMEVGAVIGAVPRKNVQRKKPVAGDVVILVGGRTGRDGIGGATGSSKEHTAESLFTAGAEVQKGNPPEERKIQRLFRNPAAAGMIKKCNDFGAGGVSVAIGELADGLDIILDAVPTKYAGLDGTEIAISESQERMAVVVAPNDVKPFSRLAAAENLEATPVALVTDSGRLKMFWRCRCIVDLRRDFLNTNGVKQKTSVSVAAPLAEHHYPPGIPGGNGDKAPAVKPVYFHSIPEAVAEALPDLRGAWLANLQDLNVCSQKGLQERFDSTVGGAAVVLPLGGKYQETPAPGMVAALPLLSGETSTAMLMTFGYNPQLARWSPFHGALYAVVEAAARAVALGSDYRGIRLTLQEYFEKLGADAARWGKPFAALLGAFLAQKKLGIPAIGGKDSMSGTFMDLHVPPTLLAFAVNSIDARKVISPEFKEAGSKVVLVPLPHDAYALPDFAALQKIFNKITALIGSGQIRAAQTLGFGGLAAAVSKMSFGNRIGMAFSEAAAADTLFAPEHGAFVLEINQKTDLQESFGSVEYKLLGHTQEKAVISLNGLEISLAEALAAWHSPLEKVFPAQTALFTPAPARPYPYFEKRNRRRPGMPATDPAPASATYLDQAPSTAQTADAVPEQEPFSGSAPVSVPSKDQKTSAGPVPARELFAAQITDQASGRMPSADQTQEMAQVPISGQTPSIAPAPTVFAVSPGRPRVFIPVFPGTNGEYDTARAFAEAGGKIETLVLRNLSAADLEQSIAEMVKRIAGAQIIVLPGGSSAGDEPGGAGKFIAALFRKPRLTGALMDFLNQREGLLLGIGNGFQALVRLGLLPYGEIRDPAGKERPALTFNTIGRHVARLVHTKVVSVLSPWFSNVAPGDVHTLALSCGEGRFVATEKTSAVLFAAGQVAARYVDLDGNPSSELAFNPCGSCEAIESISSPDGRILGRMCHPERMGPGVAINVPGEKDRHIFAAGIKYFR